VVAYVTWSVLSEFCAWTRLTSWRHSTWSHCTQYFPGRSCPTATWSLLVSFSSCDVSHNPAHLVRARHRQRLRPDAAAHAQAGDGGALLAHLRQLRALPRRPSGADSEVPAQGCTSSGLAVLKRVYTCRVLLQAGNALSEAAVQICARKVSAITGDIRQALDMCKLALDRVQQAGAGDQQGALVQPRQLLDALAAVQQRAPLAAAACLPPQQKLLLAAVIRLAAQTPVFSANEVRPRVCVFFRTAPHHAAPIAAGLLGLPAGLRPDAPARRVPARPGLHVPGAGEPAPGQEGRQGEEGSRSLLCHPPARVMWCLHCSTSWTWIPRLRSGRSTTTRSCSPFSTTDRPNRTRCLFVAR